MSDVKDTTTPPARHHALELEPRQDSPIYGCPRLKDVIVAAALKGEITEQDAADLFAEYGLRSA